MDSKELEQRMQWLENQHRDDQRRLNALSERLSSSLEHSENDNTTNRIDWLENERRQDKKALNTISERLADALETNTKQARRIAELEAELAKVAAQVTRVNNIDGLLDSLRGEFTKQIEAVEQRRIEANRESDRLRVTDRDGINRAIAEIKKTTEPVARLDQEMTARREEERRLSRLITEVKSAIDNKLTDNEDIRNSVTKIEESLRQEIRRSNDVHTESNELRRRIEEYVGKLELIEDLTRRNDAKVNEIVQLETERRVSQQTWMESQAILQAERERLFNEISERAESMLGLPDEVQRQIQDLSELKRTTEGVVATFQDTLDRIERRINEAAEIQRLQEEQFRQDWAAFQADDQKKWTTHMLLRDEQWRDHDRDYQKALERIEALGDELTDVSADLTRFQQLDQVRLQNLFNLVREMLSDYDTQLQRVR